MKPTPAVKLPKTLAHEFVEFIPDVIEEGKLYVSIEYATTVHKCACGCLKEVVTPLGPADWKLIFDGKTVSLDPSIGNWSFPCRSHYWVSNNRAVWAEDWSQARVDAKRAHDRRTKQKHYGGGEKQVATPPRSGTPTAPPEMLPWWRKLLPW
ncbi:MAG: DUF6527 family protein [Candidatus Sulfotelmatobacter sp.]|jgi:hypothetical protein